MESGRAHTIRFNIYIVKKKTIKMTLQRIKIKISGKKNKLRIMSFCTTQV